jgi:hypothetical protein|tara:strand:+ start:19 stop:168 length:150 start_codon:yes stop_codon:yes gene_type:complete
MNASAAMPVPNEETPRNILDLLTLDNVNKNAESLSRIIESSNTFGKSFK